MTYVPGLGDICLSSQPVSEQEDEAMVHWDTIISATTAVPLCNTEAGKQEGKPTGSETTKKPILPEGPVLQNNCLSTDVIPCAVGQLSIIFHSCIQMFCLAIKVLLVPLQSSLLTVKWQSIDSNDP